MRCRDDYMLAKSSQLENKGSSHLYELGVVLSWWVLSINGANTFGSV